MDICVEGKKCADCLRKLADTQVQRFFAGEIKEFTHNFSIRTCRESACKTAEALEAESDPDYFADYDSRWYKHDVYERDITFTADVKCDCGEEFKLTVSIAIDSSACPGYPSLLEDVQTEAYEPKHLHRYRRVVAYDDKQYAAQRVPELLMQLLQGLGDADATLRRLVCGRLFDKNVLGIIVKFLIKEPSIVYRPYYDDKHRGPARYTSDFFEKLKTDGRRMLAERT